MSPEILNYTGLVAIAVVLLAMIGVTVKVVGVKLGLTLWGSALAAGFIIATISLAIADEMYVALGYIFVTVVFMGVCAGLVYAVGLKVGSAILAGSILLASVVFIGSFMASYNPDKPIEQVVGAERMLYKIFGLYPEK